MLALRPLLFNKSSGIPARILAHSYILSRLHTLTAPATLSCETVLCDRSSLEGAVACHKRRPTPHNQCLGTLSSETVGVRAVFLGRSGLPNAGSKFQLHKSQHQATLFTRRSGVSGLSWTQWPAKSRF